MTDDRSEYRVTVEEALERIRIIPDYDQGDGPEPHVHTIRQGGPMLIGAHWSLKQLTAAMVKYGVEEAGDEAVAMGHGLVLIDDNGPCFIETKTTTGDKE